MGKFDHIILYMISLRDTLTCTIIQSNALNFYQTEQPLFHIVDIRFNHGLNHYNQLDMGEVSNHHDVIGDTNVKLQIHLFLLNTFE